MCIISCGHNYRSILYQDIQFDLIKDLYTVYPGIRNMRVSKLPPIRPSRYGHEKRKCWSQIALAAMGEKRFSCPSS